MTASYVRRLLDAARMISPFIRVLLNETDIVIFMFQMLGIFLVIVSRAKDNRTKSTIQITLQIPDSQIN